MSVPCIGCGTRPAWRHGDLCLTCWKAKMEAIYARPVSGRISLPFDGIAQHWAKEDYLASMGCRCERGEVDLHSPGCPARRSIKSVVARSVILPDPHSNEWSEEIPEELPAKDIIRLHALGVSWS